MNDAASAAPSDDDTMADYWRDVTPAIQEASQQRRASNRANSAALLRANGVPFESKNGGAHLIVRDGSGRIYDLEARQASAFRPGKESAKPVRASLGATDQSAAVAQEHQPCELFPIARA